MAAELGTSSSAEGARAAAAVDTRDLKAALTEAEATIARLTEERDRAFRNFDEMSALAERAMKDKARADALAARVERLEAALRQAGDWFAEYARGHLEKGADEKAQRNTERMHACYRTVALSEPAAPEGGR